MSVDLTLLPQNLAATASILAQKIDFDTINTKGGNGYILIGQNHLLERREVVKFYYWGDGAHAEPKLLSDLASPNVLEVYDAAAIDSDDAYFITPFCASGDLDDILAVQTIGIHRAVDMILGVASGASFIHSKGFLHRDLKPSNVFCRIDGTLVIGDFGSVVKRGSLGYAETKSRHSLIYRTPEEIDTGRAYEQGDVYQLGIILYQILGGSLPYEVTSWLNNIESAKYQSLTYPDDQLFATEIIEERITKGKLLDLLSLPAWCPSELHSVIRKCCRTDRSKRFESVSALIAKLNNIRAKLPDWRLEPALVLYRSRAKYQVVESAGSYSIEKMVKGATAWRKVHAAKPESLKEAVKLAEALI